MGNIYSDTNHFQQEVNLSQFRVIKSIGEGSFCKVYKVQHIHQKKLYALKVIDKEKCIKKKAAYSVVRERRILEHLDHPLICNMRFAFQDTHSMYMAVDLMMAGDLRFHITNKQYKESDILFWISGLICAIKYLHSQRIVHRDIKPENILLDQEGHVHLTDFNVASEISSKRLTSLSGTAAYFAPEVFKGCGYDEDVDWWCLGITFYECIYKKRPWSECNDMSELKQEIIQKSILYPPSTMSLNCTLALKNFLEKDPKRRLGHGLSFGWNKIVSHPFFKEIDWYSMDTKRSLPTYRPEKTSEDLTRDIKLLPETNWIQRRRTSQPDRRMSQDLKLIQDHYRSFDYTVFDDYEGFLNKTLMTVGPPPGWVKPAFPDADNGSILPVQRIFLEKSMFEDHNKIHSWPIDPYR